MNEIFPGDWGFDAIAEANPERAGKLEDAGSADDLLEELAGALEGAMRNGLYRLAADSLNGADRRAIVQFQVTPEIYDWFFNSRVGYRSRYWLSPELGQEYNRKTVCLLSDILTDNLPQSLDVRQIEVNFIGSSREEKDTGSSEIDRDVFLHSLNPDVSKVWICERRYTGRTGLPEELGFAVLTGALQLDVPRWQSSIVGLRAPCPDEEYAWLDLKGAFINPEGVLEQPKNPSTRARQLHEVGWT